MNLDYDDPKSLYFFLYAKIYPLKYYCYGPTFSIKIRMYHQPKLSYSKIELNYPSDYHDRFTKQNFNEHAYIFIDHEYLVREINS